MRELAVLFVLMVVALTVNAQVTIKAQVLDSLTREPVPFATVKVSGKNLGGFTTVEGDFLISADEQDTLIVHSLGYTDKRIPVSSLLSNSIIALVPAPDLMEAVEVVASNKKLKTKKEELGYHKEDKDNYARMNVPIGFQVAVYIPNTFRAESYLTKSYFRLKKVDFEKTYFRVRVYEYDPVRKKPGKEIYHKQVIEKVGVVKGILTVDLSSYGIQMPPQGIVLALEFLGEEGSSGQFIKKHDFFELQLGQSKNSEENRTFLEGINSNWVLYTPKATNGSSTNTMFGIEVDVVQ